MPRIISFLNPINTFLFLTMAVMLIFIAGNCRAESITLHDCLMEAMSNNTLLKEGDLNIKAGEEDIAAASGKRFPKITLDSNYTRREEPLPFVPAKSITTPPRFSDEFASWQAVMTLPLYQGGQLENGTKLAEVRQTVRKENLNLTRNEVIANTVNTYNKLLQLKELRKASKASVDALEEQHKNVALLFDVGRAAKVDLLKVDVQLSNEKQRLLSIDEGISAARETLAYLMGRKVDATNIILDPTNELSFQDFNFNFEQGLTDARKRRSEYLIAAQGVKEAELNAKNSRGKLLPAISAFSGYLDQTGFQPHYNESNWFFGLNLTMPIFDRSAHADVSRDRILKDKAEARLTSVDYQIRLDIRNAITSLTESRARLESARSAVLQAEESFRIEKEKYATGAGAMVDLLFAQAADFTAAANYTQALFDYNAAITAYRRATGSLEDYLK